MPHAPVAFRLYIFVLLLAWKVDFRKEDIACCFRKGRVIPREFPIYIYLTGIIAACGCEGKNHHNPALLTLLAAKKINPRVAVKQLLLHSEASNALTGGQWSLCISSYQTLKSSVSEYLQATPSQGSL